ncbi:YciI family protein [Marinobacter halodurans]|uniref:YciI family protein n=1 Tax=Marinobacter halodurans TaxID=2528979 RepID=UPI001F60525A|nr:YciI family protein [Marinobacter halodurans]
MQVRNGRTILTDGPFAETKEQLGGYFLVEVRDMEQALEIAAAWPSARIGSIEVRSVKPEVSESTRH